jgi:hypothetical protein
MAASNSKLIIYFKQIFQVVDQVGDIVNYHGFKKKAELLKDSGDTTNSCHETHELSKTFDIYGDVTLGLTWLPAISYFSIFVYLALQLKKYKWIGVINAFLSMPLAPLVPLVTGIILMFKNESDGMVNLVILCGLVEASFEASPQVIWQGYIIISNQLPINLQTDIEIPGKEKNLSIDHTTFSYCKMAMSILVLTFSCVTCFVPFSKIPSQKSDVLLIITSQAFRSLAYILLYSYLEVWYYGPVLLMIFTCNLIILHSAEIMENNLLLIINALLNVPMLCFFNQKDFSPYSSTSEIGSEENSAMLDTQRTEERGNKDVDKKNDKMDKLYSHCCLLGNCSLREF